MAGNSIAGQGGAVALIWIARLGLALALAATIKGAFSSGASSLQLFPWDKAEHFSAFYALVVLSLASFPRASPLPTAALLSALGALIEVIQGTPWVARDADALDWVADTAGILGAIAPIYVTRLRDRVPRGRRIASDSYLRVGTEA